MITILSFSLASIVFSDRDADLVIELFSMVGLMPFVEQVELSLVRFEPVGQRQIVSICDVGTQI